MIRCPSCGRENAENFNFCLDCGYDLKGSMKMAAAPNSIPPPPPMQGGAPKPPMPPPMMGGGMPMPPPPMMGGGMPMPPPPMMGGGMPMPPPPMMGGMPPPPMQNGPPKPPMPPPMMGGGMPPPPMQNGPPKPPMPPPMMGGGMPPPPMQNGPPKPPMPPPMMGGGMPPPPMQNGPPKPPMQPPPMQGGMPMPPPPMMGGGMPPPPMQPPMPPSMQGGPPKPPAPPPVAKPPMPPPPAQNLPPPPVDNARTQFMHSTEHPAPSKTCRLIAIDQSGKEGMNVTLKVGETICGREAGLILFYDDTFVSSKHCSFHFTGDKLVVRDEGSLNGIFVKVKGPVTLKNGDFLRIGRQLFVYESVGTAKAPLSRSANETATTWGSPRPQAFGRLVQILAEDGALGEARMLVGDKTMLGREQGEVVFPSDGFISGRHCLFTRVGNETQLQDLGSSNGTYLRARGEAPLDHGSILLVGAQMLRVEMI